MRLILIAYLNTIDILKSIATSKQLNKLCIRLKSYSKSRKEDAIEQENMQYHSIVTLAHTNTTFDYLLHDPKTDMFVW